MFSLENFREEWSLEVEKLHSDLLRNFNKECEENNSEGKFNFYQNNLSIFDDI